jgi:hypothetical protein
MSISLMKLCVGQPIRRHWSSFRWRIYAEYTSDRGKHTVIVVDADPWEAQVKFERLWNKLRDES